MKQTSLALITPAYNEAGYIEETIRSVLAQTILPQCWLIVDDGSTDETASIVKTYARKHSFIRYYFRTRPKKQAYFASNVFAIMEGYRQLASSSPDFLGILDADIRLPPTYYQEILTRFAQDDRLGIASGIYENLINGRLHKVLNDRRSTPKAIQVFRRRVFDDIQGFMPLPYGGEDTVACFMARMRGWKVWSFPEIKVVHLRPTGTGANSRMLAVRFRQGICEYHLATQPLFFFLKSARRAVRERPYLTGGLMRILGYTWAALRGDRRQLPEDLVRFIRREQWQRILQGNRITPEDMSTAGNTTESTKRK